MPQGFSLDRACFVEAVTTCLTVLVRLAPRAEDVVLTLGQGPIGLLFTMLVKSTGATMVATDAMPYRRELALRFGAAAVFDPQDASLLDRVMEMTGWRGAAARIVAAAAPRIVQQAARASRTGRRIRVM